jgi:hypothetical protein
MVALWPKARENSFPSAGLDVVRDETQPDTRRIIKSNNNQIHFFFIPPPNSRVVIVYSPVR